MEKRCQKYESDHNASAEYIQRKNVVWSRIPESVSKDVLEDSVISVLADIDVFVEVMISWLVIGLTSLIEKRLCVLWSGKNCKRVLFNKKNFGSADYGKHKFSQNTKPFCKWEFDNPNLLLNFPFLIIFILNFCLQNGMCNLHF